MTTHEENTVNMFDTVIGVYTVNETTFTGYPAIVECENAFAAMVGEIKEVDKEYMQSTSGKTAQKNSAFEEVIVDVLPVKAALYSYSVKNNLEDLRVKTSFTESNLRHLTVAELIANCEIILKEAQQHLANLTAYTVTTEKLSAFESKINALKTKSSEKGAGFTSKSALRKTLTEKLQKANDLLTDQYDELIQLVRADHNQLYAQYFAARVIKDLGGSHGKSGGDENQNPAPPTPPVQ